MDGFQARFSSLLVEELQKEVSAHSAKLATTIAPDYAGYTRRVGIIEGLRTALTLAKAIEEKLSAPDGKEKEPVRRQNYEA